MGHVGSLRFRLIVFLWNGISTPAPSSPEPGRRRHNPRCGRSVHMRVR
ncbi:hypothetical protein GJR88_03221 [Dietzia sp. DQ12-45-1b]|nr:hypothetical protein GJR88_03221 [Dietzia sp. DQ12-45-1b]